MLWLNKTTVIIIDSLLDDNDCRSKGWHKVVSYIEHILLILCQWISYGPYVGHFASQTSLVVIVSLLSKKLERRVAVPLALRTRYTIFLIGNKYELQSRISQKVGPTEKIEFPIWNQNRKKVYKENCRF